MKEHRCRAAPGLPPKRTLPTANRGWKTALRVSVLLLVVGVAATWVVISSIVSRGLSAHEEPSRVEQILARRMRTWATPDDVRGRGNPLPATPPVLDQGLEHFADHCAVCHANDGSGDTTIGRSLYPRVPDMRSRATQSLTDGELFSIIEHGIRLSGMPAWGDGTDEGERESWALVHFIRRLPRLTDADIERMETLNPKTPAQFKEEEEARQFLAGEADAPSHQIKKQKR